MISDFDNGAVLGTNYEESGSAFADPNPDKFSGLRQELRDDSIGKDFQKAINGQ